MSNIQLSSPHMGKVNIGGVCPFCHKGWTLKNVSLENIIAWQNGKLIQDALPELNADQRELLISGICDECFPK